MSFIDGCTKELCPVSDEIYGYQPALGANGTFLALFAFSGVLQAAEGLYFRKITGLWLYSVPIILGCITEILGYVGRVIQWYDSFNINGFYIQICCLTIGPAFLTAGIYFCLADIIKTFDPECESSRLPRPQMYAWIFIPCDIISLVLQGAGGGIAATAIDSGSNPNPGTNVMIAGLAWQVFTLLIFIMLITDFGIRSTLRRRKTRARGMASANANMYEKRKDFGSPAVITPPQSVVGSPYCGNTEWEPEAQMTSGKVDATARDWATLRPIDHGKFAVFLIPFIIAILAIFMRCCYRVAELSGGWTGHLIHEEGTFIGLEGV
ncbi:hypothetical protein KEM54_006271 [Ascosphaera aggregata]|nr:hypothetical protein KEM54_006271 [Ascosphaera aggregata]